MNTVLLCHFAHFYYFCIFTNKHFHTTNAYTLNTYLAELQQIKQGSLSLFQSCSVDSINSLCFSSQ